MMNSRGLRVSGKIALDSNAVIGYQRGDQPILPIITEAEELYLPATVLGEVAYGAIASSRPEKNLTLFMDFAQNCVILNIDRDVALRYARVRKNLRARGEPIPENDIWIAAICIENNVPILTRDSHFKQVDGLEIVTW